MLLIVCASYLEISSSNCSRVRLDLAYFLMNASLSVSHRGYYIRDVYIYEVYACVFE